MSGFNHSRFIKSEDENAQDQNTMAGFQGYGQNTWSAGNNSNNNPQPNPFEYFGGSSGALRNTYGSSSNLIADDELVDDDLAEYLNFDQGGSEVQSPQTFNNLPTNFNNTQQSMNGFSASMPAPNRRTQSYVNTDLYSNTPPNQVPMNSPYTAQSYEAINMSSLNNRLHQTQFQSPSGGLSQSPSGNGFRGAHSHGSASMSPHARSAVMAGMSYNATGGLQGSSQSIPSSSRRVNSSSHWEGHVGGFSHDSEAALESPPITSPMSVPGKQLSSILENEKSPPTRTRVGSLKAASLPIGASKEDVKKAKRRNAHNVVEQKRRDKINDRIQELSHLVPAHRLEDNKIKKQLASTTRTSLGMSPPNAGSSRKTSGSLTQSMVDERDKTKGNSLDGAVAWTKDLMWMLRRKLEQEQILIEAIQAMGGHVPYQEREDEQRMRSELLTAMQSSGADSFEYSRGHGSGLWVPEYTDQAGNPLQSNVAPDYFESYGHGVEANVGMQETDQRMWAYTPESARGSLDFKEQDAFAMDEEEDK